MIKTNEYGKNNLKNQTFCELTFPKIHWLIIYEINTCEHANHNEWWKQ